LIKITNIDINGDGNSDNPRYLAMAQVLKAYYYSVMVDMWGDIPYSQALQGNDAEAVKAPVYDDDQEVYGKLIGLLDAALANLALPNPASTIKGDVLFAVSTSAANKTKWTKAATSLKLKLLLQTRATDASAAAKIADIITNQQGNLITAAADDMAFQFSTSISPDYRHSNYAYGSADYGGGYVAHQLVFEMLKNGDPRTSFYFKRQTKTLLDPADATQKQTIPCSQRADCKYNYFPRSAFIADELYDATPADLATPTNVSQASFGAQSNTFPAANVDPATDVFTYAVLATPTDIATGQLVRITTTGALPAGLSSATPPATAIDAYAIKVGATGFKLATSAANATAGTAIDITDIGSGNHRIREKGIVSKWHVRAGELATAGKKVADITFKNAITTVNAPLTGLVTYSKAEGASLVQGETMGTVSALDYLSGWFGRDRADPSGVPNDTGIRTAHGLYPEGGLYDDIPEPANNNKGRGDGIFPIATSWMVKFWQLEAMLALNLNHPNQSVDQLFASAMNDQFAKVNGFATKDAAAISMTSTAWTGPTIADYVTSWSDKLTAAGTNAAKLQVVLKQAWFCNYGNGLELYNTFRRTGLPNDLQTPLQLPGNFALRLPYAQDELNLNPNTPVKPYDTPDAAVFWDGLKFQFVK
jgi:hypothetical protein